MSTFESVIAELLNHEQQSISAFFSCYRDVLPKSIKIITSKINDVHFNHIATRFSRKLTPVKHLRNHDSYSITRDDTTHGLGKHFLHTAGFFYMQEVAAGLSAPMLDIPAGGVVLDMCASPGGKTIQIADTLISTNHPGLVVANEIAPSRIAPLIYNLNRTGMYNTCITSMSGEKFGILTPNTFDAVLVDAPCSGEGTGFKSDAGTKRRREGDIHKIAALQKQLLHSAIIACKPGGSIVYSTCTLNPRENEFVVANALTTFGNSIELGDVPLIEKSYGITTWEGKDLLTEQNAEKVARFWPHRQHTGGFFIAKFRKKTTLQDTHTLPQQALLKHTSQLDYSTSLQKTIYTKLQEDFGIEVDTEKYIFIKSPTQIYVTSPAFTLIHEKLYIEKIGVPIYKVSGEKLFPLHGLGSIFGHIATKNTITLDDSDMQKYAEGYDLSTHQASTNSDKYCIIKRQNYGVSVGKISGETLKNKYIK